MMNVKENTVYSLQEIQKKLDVEQHRLIHLCEKGVIIPDIGDSAGRGTMRRFSERNLFEFALALELRRFQLPLNYIAPIIRMLEAFESYAAKDLEVFSLPQSLQQKSAIKLRLIIGDGAKLYFALKSGRSDVYLGGLDLEKISDSKKPSLSGIKKTRDDPRPTFTSFMELDLNKIATNLL
jgi:DNA-binding transcriptional MerR regulator